MKSRIHADDICHNVPCQLTVPPTSSYQDRKSRDRPVSLVVTSLYLPSLLLVSPRDGRRHGQYWMSVVVMLTQQSGVLLVMM